MINMSTDLWGDGGLWCDDTHEPVQMLAMQDRPAYRCPHCATVVSYQELSRRMQQKQHLTLADFQK